MRTDCALEAAAASSRRQVRGTSAPRPSSSRLVARQSGPSGGAAWASGPVAAGAIKRPVATVVNLVAAKWDAYFASAGAALHLLWRLGRLHWGDNKVRPGQMCPWSGRAKIVNFFGPPITSGGGRRANNAGRPAGATRKGRARQVTRGTSASNRAFRAG